MSFLTVILIGLLALTSAWLLAGAFARAPGRDARRVDANVETTATRLFAHWAEN